MATIVFMTLVEIAAAGGKITKVRWLRGLGYDNNARRVRVGMTLSYMLAEVGGEAVRVEDAPEGLTVFANTRNKELVSWAQERGVYGIGVGLTRKEVQEVF